jgi:predicted RNase H-like HicB family nuclease
MGSDEGGAVAGCGEWDDGIGGAAHPACYTSIMYKVETEQESDGRWIAEVPELPGVLAYGASREEAVRKAQALSLRVLAERLDYGENIPQVQNVFSIVT